MRHSGQIRLNPWQVKGLIVDRGRINIIKKACRLTGLGLVLRLAVRVYTVPLAASDSS
ncbi:hypothetical protein [Colwellia sp. MB02u-9]|uniref:hypothetical protein n=1 Tax=Colwellia sp. MB02u-9 TaxID=2759823 RepID=UPI0015F4A312|nr:hypothetical protein [Colwellia sp. MB02u-9]MBA6297671.1 hypothetical protein [Colwellia sp. MB02u-9]